MNDKKVKCLVAVTAIFLLGAGAVMFCVFDRLGMANKTNNYINYNVNDFVEISPVIFNNYEDVYSMIDVSKVNIKNGDYHLVSEFINKEEEIISYVSSYYNQIKSDNNYASLNTVSSNIVTQINGTILSICYRIDFNLDKNLFSDNRKSYITTINVDLITNRVFNVDDLLSKYNYTKTYIADKLFNEVILIGKGQTVIDKETNISLTKSDIERNKKQYVDRIIMEFDNIIDMYINEGSLVLIYDTKELKNVFFDNDFYTDIKFRYLK